MGVEAGAGGWEDVQEGMNGGGWVTQVHNKIFKFLQQEKKCVDYHVAVVLPAVCPISHTKVKPFNTKHWLLVTKPFCYH